MKSKKSKVILITVGLIVAIIAIVVIEYLRIYYHSDSSVEKYLNSSENVNVSKNGNVYYFDGPGQDSAIVFYPRSKGRYNGIR